MKVLLLIWLFFISGCALSIDEQSKLDQFPECNKVVYRLTPKLNGDESRCVFLKEMQQEKDDERKRQYEQAEFSRENARKIKAQAIELSFKEVADYMASDKGISDKKICNRLMLKALSGKSYISFSIQDYSRSADNFLSCTALVKYQSLAGFQLRQLSIIYNEINNVMQSNFR